MNCILGWVEKRTEGGGSGFFDKVYKVVRNIVYLDTEGEDEGGCLSEKREAATGNCGTRLGVASGYITS